MSYNHILAIDPSGSYIEGKGTSGWVLLNKDGTILDYGYINAIRFPSVEAYWQAHNILIAAMHEKYNKDLHVVIEDFMLYASKATDQINSRMETCRLLGILQMFCYESKIDYTLQRAVDVKKRWSNDILETEGLIESHVTHYRLCSNGLRINRHELDALRHGLHFLRFKQDPVWDTAPNRRLTQYYNFEDRPWEGEKE